MWSQAIQVMCQTRFLSDFNNCEVLSSEFFVVQNYSVFYTIICMYMLLVISVKIICVDTYMEV